MINNDILENLNSKKILVTGAAGLIGSSLIDELLELNETRNLKITIYALGRNYKKLEERFKEKVNSINIIEGDVSFVNVSNLNIDYIIHAASPSHPLAYSQSPVEVMKANLLGTINMLELAKNNNAKIVFISSGEIYGVSDKENSGFKENEYGYTDILNPRSCYPESKRAAETLCACYHAQYDVKACIARLCHVYGGNITTDNSRADAQFLRNVLNNEDIIMKSLGEQVRSFCYVKDAVKGILYILVKGKSGEAYNIANRKSIASVRNYAETLAKIGEVKVKLEVPEEIEKKGYSKISRAVLDAEKLENLGWEPKYNLEEGLKETYKIAQANNLKLQKKLRNEKIKS